MEKEEEEEEEEEVEVEEEEGTTSKITSLETVGIPQNTAGSPVSGLIKVFSGSTAGTTGTPGRQINRSGLPPYHLTL
ncbi:hypothetical protein HZH68_015666 [Vespula germanica]|uniref:Uncharacterized protein n=1 Tax=Vespula germanica TaxID=30212 RepID=A0A834J4J3_VESGE|nr:hypothetical protein HZH68_015666 [Vespula germanica]